MGSIPITETILTENGEAFSPSRWPITTGNGIFKPCFSFFLPFFSFFSFFYRSFESRFRSIDFNELRVKVF